MGVSVAACFLYKFNRSIGLHKEIQGADVLKNCCYEKIQRNIDLQKGLSLLAKYFLIKTLKNQMFTHVQITENIFVVFVITKAVGLQLTFEK